MNFEREQEVQKLTSCSVDAVHSFSEARNLELWDIFLENVVVGLLRRKNGKANVVSIFGEDFHFGTRYIFVKLSCAYWDG